MSENYFQIPNPFEVRAPTPQRVAKRAVVLALLEAHCVCKTEHEHLSLFSNAIEKFSLETEIGEREAAMLNTPYSALSAQQRAHLSWTMESLAALLWGLGRIELPAFTISASLSKEYPFPVPKSHRTFIAMARLRPKQEILRRKQEGLLWYERARLEAYIRNGKQPGVAECKTRIKGLTEACRNRGYFIPVDQDFPVTIPCGDEGERSTIPFRDLEASDFTGRYWTIFHRCAALSWLSGHVPEGKWENVLPAN